MSKDLRLAVKREYFEDIRDGRKPKEYRLRNAYWKKRLSKSPFDTVTITLGYPAKHETDRMLVFPYQGFDVETITHKHFGDTPEEVFAIILYDEETL